MEMDAYLVSKLYADWVAQSMTADTTVLSVSNVLSVFDQLMQNMTEKRVTAAGRLLYVTPTVSTLIKNAQAIQRNFNVQGGGAMIDRIVHSLDEVQIITVPSELMKTVYDFTTGWAVGASAKQINMMLVDPWAVITPVSYQFARLDPPSAGSEGKWVYYEESFEDVFILNQKKHGIQFNVAP